MPGYLNIDKAVNYVKTIVDNSRCIFCDKLLGSRFRYPCGHTGCEECIEVSDECLTCFNPPQSSKPLIDSVESQHVQNVSDLLTSFQETFNIDVYKRYRLSEKLKEEKQLFPECIQASVTYHNKKKFSLNTSQENKENLSPIVLVGELPSLPLMTMNTKNNLIQKWLETNEKVHSPARKPFKDINVNSPFTQSKENISLNNGKHVYNQKIEKKSVKKSQNSKKSFVSSKQKKSSTYFSLPTLKQYDAGKNKNEKKSECEFNSEKILHGKEFHENDHCNQDKNDNSTGNIDTIVIEDSPTQDIDKDKRAWLAVLESEKNESNDERQINNTGNNNGSKTKIKTHVSDDLISVRKKVCFYKKALLYKSCYLCLNRYKKDNPGYERLNSKDVHILVNTSSVLTSIKVTDNKHDLNIKKSISTQTDSFNKNMDTAIIPNNNEQVDIKSQDLFVNDTYLYEETEKSAKNIEKKDLTHINRSCDLPCQIINDSDSDVEIDCSGTFEVVADVHTPSIMDYGVLSTMTNNHQRVRCSGRRRTIDSSNSSEKENLEPNRQKKPRLGKKEMKKML